MQKIIAALDGLRLSRSTIDYAIFVARHFNAHVVGVFLDDALYHGYSYSEVIEEDGSVFEETIEELKNRDKATRSESIQIFEQAFEDAGLEYSIHRDTSMALRELLHETVYADLLIINNKETFSLLNQQAPSEFLRDLMADTHCPLLVVPKKFIPVEKLVILYDGAPSSVYAVKMFSYLLAELKYLDTEVLSVKKDDEDLHLPDNRLMKEFMKRHFPKAQTKILKGDAEAIVKTHLRLSGENTLVVLGAYHRGRVSRFFRPSMADQLLKNLKLPLFIAHNR